MKRIPLILLAALIVVGSVYAQAPLRYTLPAPVVIADITTPLRSLLADPVVICDPNTGLPMPIGSPQVLTVAPTGATYTTIAAALAAITDASATKPYTVMVMPGVYNESVTVPSTKSYLTIRGSGAGSTIWYPVSGGTYALRIEDAAAFVDIEGITFQQRTDVYPVPSLHLGTDDTITKGVVGETPATAVTPKNIDIRDCDFYGHYGPQVVGYGHEIHFKSCTAYISAVANTAYDVCVSDGDEESQSAQLWKNISPYTSDSIDRQFQLRECGLSSMYGGIKNPGTPGKRNGIMRLEIPYNGATRVCGAGVNRFVAWLYPSGRSVLAGEFEFIVKSAVDGTGTVLATIPLPAMTASTWTRVSIPITGVAGHAVGSIILNETIDNNGKANLYLLIDDAWLQTGVYGLHETCMLKTVRCGTAGGDRPGTWMTFNGCSMAMQDYVSSDVLSGHSWQFYVGESIAYNSCEVHLSGSSFITTCQVPSSARSYSRLFLPVICVPA